jgi:hypothetical protein
MPSLDDVSFTRVEPSSQCFESVTCGACEGEKIALHGSQQGHAGTKAAGRPKRTFVVP